MIASEAEPRAIFITVEMREVRIDLDVTNPVPVEEIVASFRRAGITHFICERSKGKRVGDGFHETLEFQALLPEK